MYYMLKKIGIQLTLSQTLRVPLVLTDSISQHDPIPTAISTDNIIKGFKSWKEMTTTSPSGKLGHYKAIIQDPTLLRCLHVFLNIAMERDIAIPR